MPQVHKSKDLANAQQLEPQKAPSSNARAGLAGMSFDKAEQSLAPAEENAKGPKWKGALRDASAIRDSGALEQFAKLKGVEVPKSEYDRTVEDDAILVKQQLADMTPEQIDELKKAAYEHPEVKRDLDAVIKLGFYGSAEHRQYGAVVEKLTGGVISAEEAMAMNPSGGIPGKGAKQVPLIGRLDIVKRHAMRHDATGFMLSRFGVGPGYGSKTTAVGRKKDDPLAGQVLGLAREAFGRRSNLDSGDHVAKPGRFS